jgi:uncharacterized protein (TIGR03086 family)
MSDIKGLYRSAVEEFGKRVHSVSDDQWNASTPCPDWDVRTLVNHLVNEDKWVAPLLEGKRIEQVGDAFDGDLLGADPKKAWEQAAQEAIDAVDQEGVETRTVHVSFGDIPGRDYISQVLLDHVIHAWDLARGIGADDRLEPALVEFVYEYLEPQVQGWRAAGAFGDEVQVEEGADRQTKLLAMTGRKA